MSDGTVGVRTEKVKEDLRKNRRCVSEKVVMVLVSEALGSTKGVTAGG